MEGEAVEKKLYNVASKGDVTTLVHLLEEDPYLVHGFLFPCSRNLLHIAAAGGHVEIASKLLSLAPEMCWRRDDQGMNPVHVAAMNGHVEILEYLLLESSTPAMERLHRGQTVLHLCVKHAQIEALKILVEKLGELVCAKDDDGETLLHLAVRCSQLETIQYLVENRIVKHQTRNGMGKTAVQILNESPPTTIKYLEMKRLLIDQSELSLFEEVSEVGKKLYEAASKGDVTTLQQIVKEDPYLVHGVLFPCSRNLLHIAAMHGQTSIVEEVLNLNPQLARSSDSEKSSPLHIAAARGHVEIASKLLAVAPEMCWWRDEQDMNPVHVAAMNGHVEILEHLLQESYMPAMERLHRGQTVLHLCVKHAQLRVLKVLVEKLGELVCAKDDYGETLLHLAARCGKLETIQYLVEKKALKLGTTNAMCKKALEILIESPSTSVNYLNMKRLLTEFQFPTFLVTPEIRNTIVVVVVLIATMAFQSAINPPGGVWSEDDAKSSHKAGQAVMASTHPHAYMNIMYANMAAFIASLAGMFVFTIKDPNAVYPYFFISMSIFTIGTALIAIMITFSESMNAITPHEVMKSKGNNTTLVLVTVLGILGLIPICFIGVRELHRSWLNKKRRQVDLGADAFLLPGTDPDMGQAAAPAGA